VAIAEETVPTLPFLAKALISMNAGWLLCLSLLVKKRLPKIEVNTPLKKRLKRACQNGDAKGAEEALLAWGKAKFSSIEPLNLKTMQASLTPELREAVQDLYEALYGRQEGFDGEALFKAFSSYKLPAAKKKKQEWSGLYD
jgi:hypothetical protein